MRAGRAWADCATLKEDEWLQRLGSMVLTIFLVNLNWTAFKLDPSATYARSARTRHLSFASNASELHCAPIHVFSSFTPSKGPIGVGWCAHNVISFLSNSMSPLRRVRFF